MQALRGDPKGCENTAKKLKKVLKTLLTNGKYCGMIAKLSPSGVQRGTDIEN